MVQSFKKNVKVIIRKTIRNRENYGKTRENNFVSLFYMIMIYEGVGSKSVTPIRKEVKIKVVNKNRFTLTYLSNYRDDESMYYIDNINIVQICQ